MVLEMKNISKNFGGVQALSNVSFTVKDAEIHGLLGENGAGKSTLMNILAGTFPPSLGEIIIDGVNIEHMTTKKAKELGIRFVHQELNLVNDLKVYENLFLGEEIASKFGWLSKKQMMEKSKKVLSEINLNINLEEQVSNLDTSHKQLIEIAKALLFDCKLIIMDEPTTALTNKEIEHLFSIMLKMKNKGVSMIYISHKMPELFEICDKYTVFRDGKFIKSGYFKDINEKIATELLVGKSISTEDIVISDKTTQDVVLKVSNITCEPFFRDISFDVKKSEVIAITGLHGDGRGELAEALFGVLKINSGSVFLNDKPLNFKNIKNVMNAGIGMVPRSRKERSIIKDMNIMDNLFISSFVHKSGGFFLGKNNQREQYKISREKTNIKAYSPDDLITSLSGGNQQKVILSRWLEVDSLVYILDNPTQGIDVGAKFEIYNIIHGLSNQGKSIIVFSAEFPEIYQVADRCIVMYKGRINKILNRDELNEMTIMYYATGANLEEIQ